MIARVRTTSGEWVDVVAHEALEDLAAHLFKDDPTLGALTVRIDGRYDARLERVPTSRADLAELD